MPNPTPPNVPTERQLGELVAWYRAVSEVCGVRLPELLDDSAKRPGESTNTTRIDSPRAKRTSDEVSRVVSGSPCDVCRYPLGDRDGRVVCPRCGNHPNLDAGAIDQRWRQWARRYLPDEGTSDSMRGNLDAVVAARVWERDEAERKLSEWHQWAHDLTGPYPPAVTGHDEDMRDAIAERLAMPVDHDQALVDEMARRVSPTGNDSQPESGQVCMEPGCSDAATWAVRGMAWCGEHGR